MKTIFTSILILLSIPIFFTSIVQAQTPPDNLCGEALRDWLRDNYYEGLHQTLSYRDAREHMYSHIDNQNDQIECVYSGYKKSWAYGSSGTGVSPINCEHTVPQSLYDQDLPMRSDIHHLFPTYSNWNSTRSNFPFTDIPDPETTKWIINDNSQSSIPTSNIDAYSEAKSSAFEPRESHKGNVARAVFYFYTMYPNEAGNITKVGAISKLYEWHLEDPVDAAEIARNGAIADVQGNENPFITHPEWIETAWLRSSTTCDFPTGINEGELIATPAVTWEVYPNPTNDHQLLIDYANQQSENISLELYNLNGRLVNAFEMYALAGRNQWYYDLQGIPNGHYILVLRAKEQFWEKQIMVNR